MLSCVKRTYFLLSQGSLFYGEVQSIDTGGDLCIDRYTQEREGNIWNSTNNMAAITWSLRKHPYVSYQRTRVKKSRSGDVSPRSSRLFAGSHYRKLDRLEKFKVRVWRQQSKTAQPPEVGACVCTRVCTRQSIVFPHTHTITYSLFYTHLHYTLNNSLSCFLFSLSLSLTLILSP